MFLKLYVTAIALFAILQCANAQNNVYPFSRLDIKNGLSNNRVSCIYKDADGFMWFGTTSGLNRYDGYEFKIFKHNAADPSSLICDYVNQINEGPDKKLWIYTNNGISVYDPVTEKFSNGVAVLYQLISYHVFADNITLIKKDKQGNYWFITDNKGIYYYNPSNKTTISYKTSASAITLHSNYVADVINEQNNIYWVIYGDGVIDKIDVKNSKILSRSFGLSKANTGSLFHYSGVIGSDHNLWIYVSGKSLGIYCLDTKTNQLMHFVKDGPVISLNSNVINNIVQGDDQNLWIGTDHGGINLLNLTNHKVNYLLNREDDLKSLSGNTVVLYKDNTGIIWAGTFKQGVSYFHKGIIQFPLIRHFILDNSSLPDEDVDCFAEEDNGNLWIGTNGGGLIYYDKQTKKYTQFKHDSRNPNSLSNDIIINLFIDHEHKLWIGTYFGGLNCLVNGKFIHYVHQENDPESISDDRVYTITEDADLKLWVGTFAGGLNVYDRQKNTFTHPQYQMSSEYTAIIYEDRQKNIWIGRDNGIDVIEKATNAVKHYYNQPQNKNSLVSNDVNAILQDHRGLFWIGTKDGLSILNEQTGKFINILEKEGLPSNDVLSIKEDKSGRIWFDGAHGVASITLTESKTGYNYQIHKYDDFDGLQANEFNANAALKTKDGDILFGGAHGFNRFDPAKIGSSDIKPQLLFTDFELYNKTVGVGDTINSKVVLQKAITQSRSIILDHNENVFSISFAVCDYFSPNKIVYQYKLDGFDKSWLTSDVNSRKATYTNLDAGDYTFKVKAKNINDPSSTSELTLNIKILPPFWKSTWAYILYFIAVVSLLFYIRHRGILKLKREFKVEQDKLEIEREITKERVEASRMHDLDLMKIKFLTNVSHEFRTPLSLIISPIDSMIKANTNPEQTTQLIMVKRNGRRLLNLVNQLLDFRKMESKELKLDLREGDIIEFIQDVCCSFNDLADRNSIAYVFESEIGSLLMKFDHDKIERILFNLLSNAFKFTPSEGNITVLLGILDMNSEKAPLLEIKVIDTGIGISEEKQEKIFERFFQVDMPNNLLNQGSGIGLSITHEFVKMHGGDISVESELGNGSSFVISLPINVDKDKFIQPAPIDKQAINAIKPADHTSEQIKKPVILLVEDNDDMRFYLKDNLKNTFTIIEAVNGKEGWQKALALHPSLIVSDVSMPEMNGIELCKKIREDNRTGHIPIILLTALTEEEDQLAGFSNGANDYISKPFNFEILLSKINGLLSMQQAFKKTYQKQMEIRVQDLTIVSEDEKFLKNTFDCIEKNITNYNFSVEELSRLMALSRVSLYKRLLALTGKTPVDCIRTVRLKRAVQLLEKSQLTIASIAYEVGFNNPTYFSKVFKEEYGTAPSDYIIAMAKEKKNRSEDDLIRVDK